MEITQSDNPRINSILRGQYSNVELTLPCETENLAYPGKKDLRRARGLEDVLADRNRVIIAPEIVGDLSREVRGKIKVMASPRQCGRLLEADNEVLIDGERHVVTFKGVGATTYAVKSKLQGMIEESPDGEKKEKLMMAQELLKRRRFHEQLDLGMLDLRQGAKEALVNADMEKLGARVQKSLSIDQIKAMPDANGEMREMEHFKKLGCVADDAHPVILARAMRTNFRILDLVNLKMSNQRGALDSVIQHLCQRNQEQKSQYLTRMLRELVDNELMLILEGYQVGNQYWPTHARNVSCEAEELDLEEMKKSDKPELSKNQSWAEVSRALIYAVDPTFYLMEKKNVDALVREIIEKRVKGSNVPKSSRKEMRETFWSQWKDSEDQIFGRAFIRLAGRAPSISA